MPAQKRKRGFYKSRNVKYPRRSGKLQYGMILPQQRGFVRTGGYYGRFAGPGTEYKFHDIDINDATVASGGTIQADLLTIPEGNGEEERIGRQITIKKILWRYNIILPSTATATDTSDIVRVMLIQDKQCNGAQPAVADILESDDYQSFNNLSNSKRFRVLYDKTHAMSAHSGSGRGTTDTLSYGEVEMQRSWFKNCNMQIEYDNTATTGVITSIRSNNITCLLVGRSGVAAFSSKLRIRYSDR